MSPLIRLIHTRGDSMVFSFSCACLLIHSCLRLYESLSPPKRFAGYSWSTARSVCRCECRKIHQANSFPGSLPWFQIRPPGNEVNRQAPFAATNLFHACTNGEFTLACTHFLTELFRLWLEWILWNKLTHQEPIWSLQLYCVLATAFSQVRLFLDWISR